MASEYTTGDNTIISPREQRPDSNRVINRSSIIFADAESEEHDVYIGVEFCRNSDVDPDR